MPYLLELFSTGYKHGAGVLYSIKTEIAAPYVLVLDMNVVLIFLYSTKAGRAVLYLLFLLRFSSSASWLISVVW